MHVAYSVDGMSLDKYLALPLFSRAYMHDEMNEMNEEMQERARVEDNSGEDDSPRKRRR